MSAVEAALGLVVGGVSLVVVLAIGVRWMLSTWNRRDEGEHEDPRFGS